MNDPAARDDFPTAEVKPTPTIGQVAIRTFSKMWILTGLALIAAIGLVWSEMAGSGLTIEIEFPQGHGLMPGDAVRYRGIKVGEVRAVTLADTLDDVIVKVDLQPTAQDLARDGTRFWIERPDVRIGQVRGLDTLISGRYVGVIPGPESASRKVHFLGFAEAPASDIDYLAGLEIVVEADQRYGLERGSPVTYRGIQIGRVTSVGLTNDSAGVVSHLFVQPRYHTLIRDNSRFWSNSGIDLHLGIRGLELDADTLSTIASGGVALATPTDFGDQVTTGHRFELSESPREEWLNWQPRLALGDASLPEGAITPQPALGKCRQKGGLSWLLSSSKRGWLLPLDNGRLLGPTDLLAPEDDSCQLEAWGISIPYEHNTLHTVGRLSTHRLPTELKSVESVWPVAKIRFPPSPEEVVVTCGSDVQTMPLLKERLTVSDEGWILDRQIPIDRTWHGASVVAAIDGLLIGVVVHTEQGMLIVPLTQELLQERRSNR